MLVKRRTLKKLCMTKPTNDSLGKSKIINKAIQDIGMGRYQWELFVLCGFGWLADKLVSTISYLFRVQVLTFTSFSLWLQVSLITSDAMYVPC